MENMKENICEFPEISSEILEMAKKDQAMRKAATEDYKIWNSEIDKENTVRLKEIISAIGWPTISKVGEDASMKAWLLAQHADKSLAFQKKCLEMMKELPEAEVYIIGKAYLEDRIKVAEGKAQIYGTQFHEDDAGDFGPREIDDFENLEVRRKDLGMESFKEYEERMMKR